MRFFNVKMTKKAEDLPQTQGTWKVFGPSVSGSTGSVVLQPGARVRRLALSQFIGIEGRPGSGRFSLILG